MVFQILTRVFTFGLNAYILRFVGHDVLGICNVRLALLYSSILFLSREPFRRACLRKSDKETWEHIINLIWFVVPLNIIWSLVFGFFWCSLLSQPDLEVEQYQQSVWLICLATIIDAVTEVPYIVGQYFLLSKLRIIGDTLLIIMRSLFLCVAVTFYPKYSVIAYAMGTLFGVISVGLTYFGYFYYQMSFKGNLIFPFTSMTEFFPNLKDLRVPREMKDLVCSFFKQGILKQILTEGERYMMTFFDILNFDEQGIYDVVSNLGSLAARFVFLPIEESAYIYFAQTLQSKNIHPRRRREGFRQASEVLGNLFRMMLMVGLTMISYGIPFSNTLLYLYGGENLSDKGNGTKLLQANCAYIVFIALNGVTEAFTFAVMSQEQLDKFNRKLIGFSVVFLVCSLIFTKSFGAVGFYLANSLNMFLRIIQSSYFIRKTFVGSDMNPFTEWKPKNHIFVIFVGAMILNLLMMYLGLSRFSCVVIGLIAFSINFLLIFVSDKKLFSFFRNLYKVKTI